MLEVPRALLVQHGQAPPISHVLANACHNLHYYHRGQKCSSVAWQFEAYGKRTQQSGGVSWSSSFCVVAKKVLWQSAVDG